jgi:HAD superfamily hydrolase (TIGR01509 family)
LPKPRRNSKNQGKADNVIIDLDEYDAAILDMDGVVTRSVRAHFASWKSMFDQYLRNRAGQQGEKLQPFTEEDYYRYVDGKPRYEGAQSFLESRGISLPYGSPDDLPGKETVCGLCNLKNQYFLEYIRINGVESYRSTIDFVKEITKRGKRVAVISSSRNSEAVLEASGVGDLFHATVGGVDAISHHLKGKPEPDIFLEAARRLKVSPGRAMVIEDALSGVAAGRAGGFGLVIGVDRSGNNVELKSYGANIVVADLAEVRVKNA